MARRLKVGALTGFLLVAVAALVVATGGSARASKVSQVGFAAPAKPNDYGWNQQGYIGAQKAAKATGAMVIASTGIGYENVEPVLRRLAQRGADLIIAHASGYNTIAPKVAQQFKVPVVVWDNPKVVKKGLVGNASTAAQQGAYLAGVLAAQVTKTGTLGIVVSASDENWYKQSGGFVQGARSINKKLKFRYARIGQAGYEDAAGAKRLTRQVISAGADIVFGMGDGASFGMLQAVQTAKPPAGATKVYFIDVIGDKSKIVKKGVLLTY
jgi:basic membrane protein A